MIVSIHQPNFFPWYPFFQKIENSDKFIILGHCQFEKNNFQNRFNLEGKWYTLSVLKGNDPIVDKEYANPFKDWEAIKRKLPQYENTLKDFDDCISYSVYYTNSAILIRIAEKLKLKKPIWVDYESDLTGTDRLVDICKNNGATKYYSGPSGKKYLELEKFEKENIEVIFQNPEKTVKKPILEVLENV